MTKQTKLIIIVVVIFGVLILALNSIYIVSETSQVIITQFGQPIGDAVTKPGLHVKTPLIQKANFFEKRWLEWDG
ncbi:MAG: protease modulator HflC, partial [Candidatus Aminicenantes bacterium]|nr:protease modulator HflC [Candidatus Aminicenantes bacterium]